MHVNTVEYKRMQENIGEQTRIQGNTREYKGIQGNSGEHTQHENVRRAQENTGECGEIGNGNYWISEYTIISNT